MDKDGPRVNEEISVSEIRLVDSNGEMIGVVSTKEGLRRAEEEGLDLVEIAPNSVPPVCKIFDYGKYKYEQQKKAAEARKKQKVTEVKEIKVRPNIEEHDYQVKLRNANRFLSGGDKVKLTLRFRGREVSHNELGMKIMERFIEDLSGVGKPEMQPKMEGRQMMMVLVPDK